MLGRRSEPLLVGFLATEEIEHRHRRSMASLMTCPSRTMPGASRAWPGRIRSCRARRPGRTRSRGTSRRPRPRLEEPEPAQPARGERARGVPEEPLHLLVHETRLAGARARWSRGSGHRTSQPSTARCAPTVVPRRAHARACASSSRSSCRSLPRESEQVLVPGVRQREHRTPLLDAAAEPGGRTRGPAAGTSAIVGDAAAASREIPSDSARRRDAGAGCPRPPPRGPRS